MGGEGGEQEGMGETTSIDVVDKTRCDRKWTEGRSGSRRLSGMGNEWTQWDTS